MSTPPTRPDHLAQRERQALCDLLTELGPDAPTLCEGWRSADLAAHLYVRDRRPDSTLGMALKLGPLTTWSERVRTGARDTLAWGQLVEGVRTGPPRWGRPLDQAFNAVEYFVHYEDLRRAEAGWQTRELPSADSAELWKRTGFVKLQGALGRLIPGYHAPAARLEADGLSPITISAKPGPTVKGPAGEVVLWLFGRRSVAQVEVVEP